jgi:hypothetical protein
VTIRSQWFILTCSNIFFTYANVKHFQVFYFVGCCWSALLLQCVKAIICFTCCLEIITILFFSICAIIKTWFSYSVPIHYYLLCAIFHFFVFHFCKSLLFVAMFYLFSFMCRCFSIVFCCFAFFSSWTSCVFSIYKIVVIFSFGIHYKFLFFSLFFKKHSMFHNDEPTSKKPYNESF